MIDWLTLRTPLNFMLKDEILERVQSYIGEMKFFDGDGALTRTKLVWDIDRLRSDEIGLFWQIQYSGSDVYMAIGASPATIEHGDNVFGSSDIKHCANVLLSAAENILGVKLPAVHAWDCRRLDFTHNYLLDDHSQVKQALRELRKGDGLRQKASVPKGDTVYYGQGSDLIGGKIYDKGSQIDHLQKIAHRKNKPLIFDNDEMLILKRLLRAELKLGRRWFDRLNNKYKQHDFSTSAAYLDYLRNNKAWLELTHDDLNKLHTDYFAQFIGNIEVTDMNGLLNKLNEVCPTLGRAKAAHNTWALIKTIGYHQAQASMPDSTFSKHRAWLLKAGLSAADLMTSNIVPFRRQSIKIDQPVLCWSDLLLRAA